MTHLLNATTSQTKAAKGFDAVSSMENDLATIGDLARMLIMAAEGAGLEYEKSGAFMRIGSLLINTADAAEEKRGEAFHALHGLCHGVNTALSA